MDYSTFLHSKAQLRTSGGFVPLWMPKCLFDFQSYQVDWALREGRTALFDDCGLGKTPMQLVWAENVVRHTNKPVLILTPLAVGAQTVREGQKFGVECHRSSDGTVKPNITITNYERLHYFDPARFAGVVCDESSILKNFDGATKEAVTEFLRRIPYRLLCTATAAPNDYIEFGTSSEALGGLGYMDMLGMFFKNDQNSLHPTNPRHNKMQGKWRFKPHAEQPFWRWLCSWARAVRKPSDLGFPDRNFVLPELRVNQHIVKASRPLDGYLFTVPAHGLAEQRSERKHTLTARCEQAAQLASTTKPVVAWCHLNPEGDLLTKLIPGAVQISGADADEVKEERFEAFAAGQIRCLVTKPVMAGFGLNWQHCAHMTMFPSHSFEQYYQSTRRCWRFGQTQPVTVDVITTEGESDVMQNLQRKADAAARIFEWIVQEMGQAQTKQTLNGFHLKEGVPAWLNTKTS